MEEEATHKGLVQGDADTSDSQMSHPVDAQKKGREVAQCLGLRNASNFHGLASLGRLGSLGGL